MLKLGPPKQIAYAVPDAFEAAKMVKDFGAGPFCSEHIPVTDVIYRGSHLRSITHQPMVNGVTSWLSLSKITGQGLQW